MDAIFPFICAHAQQAHYLFFFALLLAGMNVPISEDVLLLTGGALVSRCIPDSYWYLYSWIFVGCVVSGWEAYGLGRWLGPKLYHVRWFSHFITPHRIAQLHVYYERFGLLTFVLGRFVPGGVRNALFITAGMGKMPFFRFAWRDFIAALISTQTVYYLGFLFGEHYETILQYFVTYNRIAIAIILVLILSILLRTYRRYGKSKNIHPS